MDTNKKIDKYKKEILEVAEKKGLSKSDLAGCCTMKPSSVRRWFNEKNKDSKFSTVLKLSEALGLEIQFKQKY